MKEEKLKNELRTALKERDSLKISVLRMLVSAIHNKKIEKRVENKNDELKEGEIAKIVAKEAKKRKEAMDAYKKGNRNDLAEKEKLELEIINNYLPEELNKKQISNIVNDVLSKIDKGLTKKDFGRVMKEIAPKIKGRADMGLISEIIKEKLSHE